MATDSRVQVDPLDYILAKFGLDITNPLPIRVHLSRHCGLTKLWHELSYKVGAEIGVEQGYFSKEICRDNPGVRLFCIDPWQAYSRYKDHVSQEKLDGFYHDAVERLAPYNCDLVRQASLTAVQAFQPETLDFVFIDGNHDFDYVVRDIIAWAPIVRKGGMLAGHDYKREGGEKTPIPFGVIQAVNSYTSAHKISPWFVTHGDRCPSWFFIKT